MSIIMYIFCAGMTLIILPDVAFSSIYAPGGAPLAPARSARTLVPFTWDTSLPGVADAAFMA